MNSNSTNEQQKVLVFRTNINKHTEVKKLHTILNVPEILKWNVDVDDCDKVLRVITTELTNNDIILALTEKGFECAELL